MQGLIIAERASGSLFYAALKAAYSLLDGNSLGSECVGLVISQPRQASQIARGMGLVAVL